MTIMPIRDVNLFVKVMGQGTPLVLMHGGPGLDHTSLLPLRPCANQFTLIFYDQRCNGRSVGAPVTSMTFENLTADADALRQKLGFDRWAVLGHSFGGNVALEYALRYPQSLSHLIIMDTVADVRWVQQVAPEIIAKRGYSPTAVQAVRRFFNGQITPGEVPSTVMKFFTAYFYRINLLSMAHETLIGPRQIMRPEASVFGASQVVTGWTVMDRLDEIKAPTLVMAGRHDFLSPAEHLAIVADRLPDARLEIIERAGHNPQMEQAAQVNEIIKSFLTETRPVYA